MLKNLRRCTLMLLKGDLCYVVLTRLGYIIPSELCIVTDIYPASVIRECYEVYIISTGVTEYVTIGQIETIDVTSL